MKRIVLTLLGGVLVVVLIVATYVILGNFQNPRESPQTSQLVIVPHHDIVKSERLKIWDMIDVKSAVQQLILFGPDHFGERQDRVVTTSQDLTTKHGLFTVNTAGDSAFSIDARALVDDHAVTALLGELKANFPNAQIKPFLIGERIDPSGEDFKHLQDYISKQCRSVKCLIIASVDFSHYVTLDVINQQDARTIGLLEARQATAEQFNKQDTIEVDCPNCLNLVNGLALDYDLTFNLVKQTNSANGNYETSDTTSHIFAIYRKE